MNKEELLKEIMELPKVEVINPISTRSSINVDDLMSAVDRLNKIPDYNDLLKENQELKKQIDELNKQLENTINSYTEEHNMRHNSDLILDVLNTQKKEFIKYLKDEIEKATTNPYTKLSEYGMNRIHIYKEILQKYKEIIGDD